MSHLRSTTPYPFDLKFHFDFSEFYDTPKADALYRHQPDFPYDGSVPYRIFKFMNRSMEDAQRLAARRETYEEILKELGITDYSVLQPGVNRLDFGFKTLDERMIAASRLVPNQVFEIVFIHCSENIEDEDLQKMTDFLQTSYDEVDLESAQLTHPVKLRPNFNRHLIHAQVRAADIPRVLVQATHFTAAFNGP